MPEDPMSEVGQGEMPETGHEDFLDHAPQGPGERDVESQLKIDSDHEPDTGTSGAAPDGDDDWLPPGPRDPPGCEGHEEVASAGRPGRS